MNKFSQRSSLPEIMDDLELSGEGLRRNLDEISSVNRMLGGVATAVNAVETLIPGDAGRVTIIDIGCGSGDILRVMAKRLRERNVPARLIGIDANAATIAYARELSRDFEEIEFCVEDIFSKEFRKQNADIITCSLFAHHFSTGALEELFPQLLMQSRWGVVINDLHRHPLAYYVFRIVTFILGASSITRHDGSVSILRGFRKGELTGIMQRSSIESFGLKWKWAFRWQLIIRKSKNAI